MTSYRLDHNRRKGGGAIFFLFALGVFLTLGLYFVKTRAQTAKGQAAALERQLKAEEAEVFKLKSELAFLASPARLEPLAQETLGLENILVERVITLGEIDSHFPFKEDQADKNRGDE